MIQTQPVTVERDIYRPDLAEVLKVQSLTRLEALLELRRCDGRPLGHKPGQFVEVSVAGIGEAPISVSSSPTRDGTFELVVRNVGNVSGALHRLRPGDRVGIRGPFGTSFPVEGAMRGRDLLFICGGIGLVPVRSAIDYVMDHRRNYGRVTILIGTKTPADRLLLSSIQAWKEQRDTVCLETVDRGDETWPGPVGVITTLIPKVSIDPSRTVAIICGPPIMYKFVILELDKIGLARSQMYLSLERHMKCGVGKCGHCQVNGLYVCQEGPVFCYADIQEVREAI